MTIAELRPGNYVRFGDDDTRIISRIIQHPAGRVIRWVGGRVSTAASVAREGRVIPRPLREPDTTIELLD